MHTRWWDFSAREQHLAKLTADPQAWRTRELADTAALLEALGVSLGGFVRLLRHTKAIEAHDQPAALSDVCEGYRIGVAPQDQHARTTGAPIGVYEDVVFLVWPKSQSEMRAGRTPRAPSFR